MDISYDTPGMIPDLLDPLAFFQPGVPETWFMTTLLRSVAGFRSVLASFIAERLQEDVETRQALLLCTSLSELQHVQARFVQRAVSHYHDEAANLVERAGKLATDMRSGRKFDA